MRLSNTSPTANPADAPVATLVVTRDRAHSETIAAILTQAGHAVRCTWLADSSSWSEAIERSHAEVVVLFLDDDLVSLAQIKTLRGSFQPRIPVMVVSAQVDEARMTDVLRAGAQDLVSLEHPSRLRRVWEREVRTYRRDCALISTVSSARKHQDALSMFLASSAELASSSDAIAHIDDQQVLDTNRAWHSLLNYPDDTNLQGRSILDFFARESHTTLQGALAVCLAGQWHDHALKVSVLTAAGHSLPIEARLAQTSVENKPAIRLRITGITLDVSEGVAGLTAAARLDPTTDFLLRHHFVNELNDRLQQPIKAGVRYLLAICPDQLDSIVNQIGPLALEDFMAGVGSIVRAQTTDADLGGRFTSSTIMLLVERGTVADVMALANEVVAQVSKHIFSIGTQTLTGTVSIGITVAPTQKPDLKKLVSTAINTLNMAQKLGGKQARLNDYLEGDTRLQSFDKVWVPRIQNALRDNKFRLAHQPIANLQGGGRQQSDLLIRLLGEDGKDILPSEFIPAAERSDLMTLIDRWVIEAALGFCADHDNEEVFIRLAPSSVKDMTLISGIKSALQGHLIQPDRLCFQVTHTLAEQYLVQTKTLFTDLRLLGCKTAIDHFGSGRDPQQLVDHLKPNVIKIDGSLMQALATNEAHQEQVKYLVKIAHGISAQTIAERVENASTMAALWQLGVQSIQGFFVRAPEAVEIKGERITLAIA